ncbi:MAG: hypothetical protein IJ809_04680 [Clostridia bacterium]|nr:hypothetical protein [Clostridia bacterium]
MKCESEEKIMSAVSPFEIYTQDLNVIEKEKNEYLKRFRPKEYATVKNFILNQKVTVLYRKAVEMIESGEVTYHTSSNMILIKDDGSKIIFEYDYSYDIKIGTMYVTKESVIFVIKPEFEKYYNNYVSKTKFIPKLNRSMWENVQYMFPKLSNNFRGEEGFVIESLLPNGSQIYPLREVLNYFSGYIKPEYVASILTKLYYFECYLEILKISHNALTVDNLFFAPGKFVEEGAKFNVSDLRIVGVYGGWFFSTNYGEKISGVPAEIYSILPKQIKNTGYSSYVLDLLAIKQVARNLLNFDSSKAFQIPEAMKKWITESSIKINAYEEFKTWEDVVIESFGKRRFAEMGISIN